MAYTVVCLTNENKGLLVDFEKIIRETEPEIWTGDFDVREYKDKVSNRDFNTQNNIVISAIKDNKIIGRCDLIMHESMMDFQKTGYIDWIYVEKTNRGSGIGKVLIEKAVEQARQLGAEYCYLFTAGNAEAQAFYKGLDILELDRKEVAHRYF